MKRTVRSYLKPYWPAFSFALGQVLFISALELLKPWPLKIIIDNVLSGKPLPWGPAVGWSPHRLLLFSCIGLVVVYVMLGGLHILNNYTTIRIGQGMVNDLRRDLYSHLQRLSLSFYHRQQLGDLMYRITADTMGIQTLTMNGLFAILSASVLLGGMLIVMFWVDWYLTLLALAVCPALFCAIALLNKKMSLAATEAHQKGSTVYSVVQRTLSGMRVIQAFTKEEDEGRRFLQASTESLAAELRLYNLQNFYYAVVNLTIAAGTAAILWVGTRHVLAGDLSVGEMIVFTSYLASLYGPINSIFQTYGLVQSAKAGVRRAFEILESEERLPDGSRVFQPLGPRGQISFEDVSFGYDASQPVLKKINLHVAAGKKIAIVGPTGAGKSTLVSLLPRFYDPQSGQVKIDGVDIREFELKSLRQKNCHDSSASSCLPSHHSRKHRLRPTRRIYGRNRLCSPGGAGPRICRAASPKIRDCRERARIQFVGRTEIAPDHRPRDLAQRSDPDFGRAHLLRGLGDRGAYHGGAGAMDGRPDHFHYRASSLNRSASRSYLSSARWPHC